MNKDLHNETNSILCEEEIKEESVSEVFNNKGKGGENDSVDILVDTDKDSEAEIVENCDSISDADDDGLNHNENKLNIHVPSPTNSTNFSITEILKPSFGCKAKEKLSPVSPHHKILLNEFHRPLHNNYDFLDKLSILNQYYVNSVITKDFLNDTTGRSVSPDSNSDSETTSKCVETKCSAVVKLPVSEARCTTTPWPAWVYCTRYSDRPSAGPRSRKLRRKDNRTDEKRPRTAFTNEQLVRLKSEFESCRYLTEQARKELSKTLNLSESQIKIWFQNKRAKIKKSSDGVRSPLALHLMAQGLYHHVSASAKQKTNDVAS